MAGGGYLDFVDGNILSAEQVDTYLNQQSIMVFASAAARTTALSAVLAEGMHTYLLDTNSTEVYTGAAWQVVLTGPSIDAATSKTTPVDADLIPISDSAASFGLKSLSWANIKVAIFTAIGALTGKTTPVGADTFVISDSAASGVGKSVTWTNILATLLAYFKLYFRRASFRTQATANSTLTLVVGDNEVQEFTGTTAGQIVQQPDVTTLFIGYTNRISNKSTQTIAVNSSGGNLIYTVPAGTDWLFTCNAITGTTASSWSNSYVGASAAPAVSSGLALIKRASFSGVADTGTTFDNMFSTTYTQYLIVLENMSAATPADDLYIRMRSAGPTTLTAAFQQWRNLIADAGASVVSAASDTKMIISRGTGDSVRPAMGKISIGKVGNASERPVLVGDYYDPNSLELTQFGAYVEQAGTYLGFILSSSSSNITGTVSVYGLAVA